MNWFGITPPFTASTNSKPSPRASGSTRRYTSPNWPAPPVCFLCRWWPSAFAGDRLAVRECAAAACSTSSLNCVAMRSSTERRCRSPSPRSTVSCVIGSCSTRKRRVLGGRSCAAPPRSAARRRASSARSRARTSASGTRAAACGCGPRRASRAARSRTRSRRPSPPPRCRPAPPPASRRGPCPAA